MTTHDAAQTPWPASNSDARENVDAREFPDPARFDSTLKAFMRTAHDLGGEAGGPIQIQEREPMAWEKDTMITCECLAWRGVWNHTEKLRRVVDLGETQYFSLPYAGRFLLSATRALVDKQIVTLAELTNKIDEVKKRHEQK